MIVEALKELFRQDTSLQPPYHSKESLKMVAMKFLKYFHVPDFETTSGKTRVPTQFEAVCAYLGNLQMYSLLQQAIKYQQGEFEGGGHRGPVRGVGKADSLGGNRVKWLDARR